MSARIVERVNTGTCILIVALAGCNCGKLAMVKPPGPHVAVGSPQFLSPAGSAHYFGASSGHLLGDGFSLRGSDAWMAQDPWAGTPWEGYCFGDIAFSTSACGVDPFPVGARHPLPVCAERPCSGSSSIFSPIAALLKRLGLISCPRRAVCRKCVPCNVLRPCSEEARDMLPRGGSLRDGVGTAENQLDGDPPASLILRPDSVVAEEETQPPPETDIREAVPAETSMREEVVPDSETQEDAGEVGGPSPASTEDDSPAARIIPRNALPERVTPPDSSSPPRNTIPIDSGNDSAGGVRHDTHLSVCRLAIVGSSANESMTVVKLREIRD